MKQFKSIRHYTACIWLGTIVLFGMALCGCVLNDRTGNVMAQEAANSQGNGNKEAPPPGYPYSPEGLWMRLVEVIKTHPDELTYRKFGEIFGLEFDEDKMGWYGDRVAGKYFLLVTNSIKNTEAFPFKLISLSQSAPDTSFKELKRSMVFNFDPFDHKNSVGALLDSTRLYCIKPQVSDLEALGYRYDEFASTMPPPTDKKGMSAWTPYIEKIFIGDSNNKRRASGSIHLQMLPGGCLVGISYFNHP